jgi:hypothetical protein
LRLCSQSFFTFISMKKIIPIFLVVFSLTTLKAQNLIKNPSFESHWGGGCYLPIPMSLYDSFNVITSFDCTIKDWIRISETPDGYWFRGNDLPKNNYSNYIYPHSDSVCVGGGFFSKLPNTLREIIEGKLTKPLIASHHYQFSMYVQLFDTIDAINVGKIVGINSFSAVFTDTMIPSHVDLPIQNYTPQVQINQMVTDTQHWVLLMDTFVANGGEQFVSIGNFKPDSLTQFVLVDSQSNLPEASYYFIDDVSLIDLDDTASGINEQVAVEKLEVYPNPASNQLTVGGNQFSVNTIEVSNVLGQVCISIINYKSEIINVAALPSGIYFIKATDTNGNVMNGKFVKE